MYSGNYNFNLDNSVVFGLEREDEQMNYNKDLTGDKIRDAYVTSSYFDFQSRVTKIFMQHWVQDLMNIHYLAMKIHIEQH